MKVQKLLHTRMRVSDMDQTIAFYTKVLGLEVLERKVSPRGSHLAFLRVPNSEELIELCSFPPAAPSRCRKISYISPSRWKTWTRQSPLCSNRAFASRMVQPQPRQAAGSSSSMRPTAMK